MSYFDKIVETVTDKKLEGKKREEQKKISKVLETIDIQSLELWKDIIKCCLEALFPFPCSQMVNARAKGKDSIVGKIQRKYSHLEPEAIRAKLMDLIGGQVVFLNAEEVYSAAAEIPDYFQILEQDSEDTGIRLGENKFGYRSVHFIVECDAEWLSEILPGGKETSPWDDEKRKNIKNKLKKLWLTSYDANMDEVKKKKAVCEIQLRTLLQHTWAMFAHDISYKGQEDLPQHVLRAFNALAAIFENADNELVKLSSTIKEYHGEGLYRPRHELYKRLYDLAILMDATGKPGKYLSEFENISSILKPDKQRSNNIGLQDQKKLDSPRQMLDTFMPKLFTTSGKLSPIELMALESCLAKCEKLIESSNDLPWALAGKTMFKLALLYQQKYQTACGCSEHESDHDHFLYELHQTGHSINLGLRTWDQQNAINKLEKDELEIYDALLRLINLCNRRSVSGLSEENIVSTSNAKEAIEFLYLNLHKKSRPARKRFERAPVFECIKLILELGRPKFNRRKSSHRQPIVMLVGGGKSLMTKKDKTMALKDFEMLFIEAQKGACLPMLIAGAHDRGISTILPDSSIILKDAPTIRYGGSNSNAKIRSSYSYYSIYETLLAWSFLAANGIPLTNVSVVGFGLGNIAHLECKLALALGARVTVINHKDFNRKFTTFEDDLFWSNHPSLVRLPVPDNNPNKMVEPLMLRVFMLFDQQNADKWSDCLGKDNFDGIKNYELCKIIYEKKNSGKKFSALEKPYQLTSLHREAFFHTAIKDLGYEGKEDLSAEELDRYGEMEHARWYIMRWLQGTRYDKDKIESPKDPSEKRSPYMVAWVDLKEDDKQKNRAFWKRWQEAEKDLSKTNE